jgi:hypothetical protein
MAGPVDRSIRAARGLTVSLDGVLLVAMTLGVVAIGDLFANAIKLALMRLTKAPVWKGGLIADVAAHTGLAINHVVSSVGRDPTLVRGSKIVKESSKKFETNWEFDLTARLDPAIMLYCESSCYAVLQPAGPAVASEDRQ